ncbi:MAG: lytic transglycosylase domain-containing protein [Agriterribacter sp.]
MQKNFILLATGICMGVVLVILTGYRNELPRKPLPAGMQWSVPPLPDSIQFCEESVPLYRQDIREQFERELLYSYYLQNQVLYVIKLSRRYFPIIEAKLRENGLPDDMKYLCVAESNLQNAVWKAGAAGFWQFMTGTAPAYGLEVNQEVDERYHIEKSTDAACKYLKAAYNRLGSWTAAAASYNCGQGGYSTRAGFQKTKNYYDLLLPDETNKYVFRILAFKYLLENPGRLGFVVIEREGYAPLVYKSVIVNTAIPDLTSFAAKHSISYKTLVWHNPWIRGKQLSNPKGKNYQILIPQ